jgi:hypothetical protein
LIRSVRGGVVRVGLAVEQAWRLLTNNYRADEHGLIHAAGDPEIIDVLTHTARSSERPSSAHFDRHPDGSVPALAAP